MRTVLAVYKWMHSRRVLMTLKAQFPPGLRYFARTYAPEGMTRDSWSNGAPPSQTGDVIGNWNNIPDYLARGDLAEITRADDGSCV